jgi:PAS domain S-box-containing protein
MDDDLRILVLGDEESPEDLIEYELSKSNLRFIMLRVTSREAFLQALQESSPNFILVTNGCAGVSSLTAMALAQEICPQTPCFLIRPSTRQGRATQNRADYAQRAGHEVQGNTCESSITGFFEAIGITSAVRPETEAPLNATEALQPLMQVAGVAIILLSPEGHILEFSQGAERLTGWRRHEILGKNGIELIFPEADRISAMIHMQRVLSGKSTESIDLRLQARNGATSSFRWYCNLISDRHGLPAGFMVVGQLLAKSKIWENQPRGRLARAQPYPAVSRGRGLLTRRTGTC